MKERPGASKPKEHARGVERGVEQDRRLQGLEPSTSRDLPTKILQVLTTYGARSPHFIAKALGVDERLVLADLKELQKEGKIHLRASNIEWKWEG